MNDQLKLLQALSVSNPTAFRLVVMELLGLLLTMMHWQRGIIDMLVVTKTVPLEGEWLENWNRVIKDLESYEQFAWELAPSRAMLPILRHHRITGEVPNDLEALAAKDNFGRIPYGNANLDYIENILRRVMDCRTYEAAQNGKAEQSQE